MQSKGEGEGCKSKVKLLCYCVKEGEHYSAMLISSLTIQVLHNAGMIVPSKVYNSFSTFMYSARYKFEC